MEFNQGLHVMLLTDLAAYVSTKEEEMLEAPSLFLKETFDRDGGPDGGL